MSTPTLRVLARAVMPGDVLCVAGVEWTTVVTVTVTDRRVRLMGTRDHDESGPADRLVTIRRPPS